MIAAGCFSSLERICFYLLKSVVPFCCTAMRCDAITLPRLCCLFVLVCFRLLFFVCFVFFRFVFFLASFYCINLTSAAAQASRVTCS